MSHSPSLLVLASGSPRRAELINILLPRDRVIIRPPTEFVEPLCDDPQSLKDVERFVVSLAEQKAAAAIAEFGGTEPTLTADTVVVANDSRRPVVLGKPPEGESANRTLKHWWCELLSSRDHHVLTGLCLTLPRGEQATRVVTTRVRFVSINESMADWYLATGEPAGKAGGYAIQGAGAAFVESLEGSFTNVVGLPVWETAQLLDNAGIAIDVDPVNKRP